MLEDKLKYIAESMKRDRADMSERADTSMSGIAHPGQAMPGSEDQVMKGTNHCCSSVHKRGNARYLEINPAERNQIHLTGQIRMSRTIT
jgi:hypothetical protein